jgi:hypothetical protein
MTRPRDWGESRERIETDGAAQMQPRQLRCMLRLQSRGMCVRRVVPSEVSAAVAVPLAVHTPCGRVHRLGADEVAMVRI